MAKANKAKAMRVFGWETASVERYMRLYPTQGDRTLAAHIKRENGVNTSRSSASVYALVRRVRKAVKARTTPSQVGTSNFLGHV